MQLKDIEYVSAVASEKNFSAAAEKLFISQPALSQAIKRLENELGVVLFNRSTSSVQLSSAGELFLAEGETLLRLSHQLKQHMANLAAQKSGSIRIGISTFYSSYYLARILPAFRSLHPGIRISIVEGKSHELESMAIREEVDFSLIPMPLDQPELVRCHILHQEQILFAIPADSPLRSQLHVSMSMDFPFIDLSCASQEPFIFLHRDQRFYATALRLCQDAGFSPDIVCELTNWDAINALIGSGAGVGFVPELVTQRNLKDVPVPIYCRIINQLVTRPYVIAYKKERELSPAASDFLEFIQALFKE